MGPDIVFHEVISKKFMLSFLTGPVCHCIILYIFLSAAICKIRIKYMGMWLNIRSPFNYSGKRLVKDRRNIIISVYMQRINTAFIDRQGFFSYRHCWISNCPYVSTHLPLKMILSIQLLRRISPDTRQNLSASLNILLLSRVWSPEYPNSPVRLLIRSHLVCMILGPQYDFFS